MPNPAPSQSLGDRMKAVLPGQALTKRIRRDKAQTLLEFAFVMPVIIIFIGAIVDFGIALDRKIVLTNAAREAARHASLGIDTDPTSIKQVAVDQSQELITTADVTVEWVDKNNDTVVRAGEPVIVRINFSYKLPFLHSVSGLFGGIPLPTDVNLGACADMALGQDVNGVTVSPQGTQC